MTIYRNIELNPTMVNMLEDYSSNVSKSIVLINAGESTMGKLVSFFVNDQTDTCRFIGSGISESFAIGDVTDITIRTMSEDDTDLSLFKPIHNHDELALELGVMEPRLIKKYIYKAYACGPWIELHDDKISLGSIVEGSDVEIGPFDLKYPISLSELYNMLDVINNLVDESWEDLE